MSKRKLKLYSSEFEESAIKLALEGEKPIAQTANEWVCKNNKFFTSPREFREALTNLF